MGSDNSATSNLWRNEFRKKNIGYNEIVIIGNNLGNLRKPEFIPNVFQLIELVKDEKDDPHKTNAQMYKSIEQLKNDDTTYIIKTGQEISDLKESTKESAEKAIKSMKEGLR